MIIGSVNVATTASIQFTVDPTIGPDSSAYFIRFTSAAYHDPTTPTYPYEQFSARFTMTGMTGTFNATVQSQINGATGAAALPTSSAAPPSSSHAASNTPAASGAGSNTSSAKGASNTGAAKSAAFPRVAAPSSGAQAAAALLAAVVLALAL
ncbi:hypothetical protein CALCODRAFT_493023 [Calocera cornea HHB12733]|uniref:Uncharacterized protein n=1 Tax=Calocera cornea HHB12733 TaxID=1353952 RepID=A0A165I1X8_9BASI|nr:hypothetical protein CALCODRAFT_493023 [Calocera cornea HHB12733]